MQKEKEHKEDYSEVLDVASQAGHILLQNGAEISRVEDTMSRIASYYGVDSGNFFVLSNGIFTTGSSGGLLKSRHKSYANVEYIPIRGSQLDKVIAVNDLSFDISQGKCTLPQARERLVQIRDMKAKPAWEQILGAAFGAGGFCGVFGGHLVECCAAFCVGALLQMFILWVSTNHLSKLVASFSNAAVMALLCILCYRIHFGDSLSNIMIGAVMPLVPGVPFVNGVRDMANQDYIAGLTRLTDAMLGFLCIALGVSFAFIVDAAIAPGGIVELTPVRYSEVWFQVIWQIVAAASGTIGFAIIYSFPRSLYVPAGIVGAIGWVTYLGLTRTGATPAMGTLAAATVVGILSRFGAVFKKCPSTAFILAGLFPLVPGAGIFWCTYYMVSNQFSLSISAGYTALKVALAIVIGIIIAMELPQSIFSGNVNKNPGRRHQD